MNPLETDDTATIKRTQQTYAYFKGYTVYFSQYLLEVWGSLANLGQPISNTYMHKQGIGHQKIWHINIGMWTQPTHLSLIESDQIYSGLINFGNTTLLFINNIHCRLRFQHYVLGDVSVVSNVKFDTIHLHPNFVNSVGKSMLCEKHRNLTWKKIDTLLPVGVKF